MPSNHTSEEARQGRAGGRAERALGRPAKYVDAAMAKAARTANKKRRLEQQREAKKLVPEQRVAHCLWTPANRPGSNGDVIVLKRGQDARFAGLQTCGSVWACPVCSAKISEVRRQELHQLLDWAEASGHTVLLMTLTARHRRTTNLKSLLDGMGKAKRRLRQSRAWRGLKDRIVGTVTALEVTYGENGWHPHYHILLFTSGCTSQQLRSLYAPAWQKACVSVGLPMPSDKHGCTVHDGSEASRYVTKWGLEDEMTKANTKVAKRKGKTPFGLLRAILDEDDQEYQPDYAATLFRTYSKAMKGARQLHWSVGLRQKLAMAPEISDQQLAEHVTDERSIHLANISLEQWKAIRKAKAEPHILTAAESLPPGASVILAQIVNGYLEREQAKAGRGTRSRGRAPDLPVSSSQRCEQT